MSWKKIYAIYVTEVLLYLLLHAAQIRKGLFSLYRKLRFWSSQKKNACSSNIR